MEQGTITRILQLYGIEHDDILAPQKGYRNSSFAILRGGQPPLNLILYKNEPGMLARIIRTNAIGNFLHARGMPARRTFSPRIMQLKSAHQTRHAALYYYVSGSTIPWEAYTMERIKTLGKTMGNMHSILADYSGDLPDIADELIALNRRMVRYFVEPDVARAMSQKLNIKIKQPSFMRLLASCKNQPSQALHMDFVRGNILFEGDDITGILDFEKAGRGTPAFDIARTLAFLLIDCKYKSEDKTYKYFIQSGYTKRSASTFRAWQSVDRLVQFFLLHDFYKFLRHNPYEHLEQNEHFVRTKAMLLKHGIIERAHVK
nr:Phosphotransferase enzyme family [uncultured bacterium]AIA17375.1 Phosphotransferase enzyme family [uncultured bacterium]